LVAFAASSRGIKLRQLASGCVYADETNKTFSVTHTEKINALKELLELNDTPLLVVYSFISELTMIKEHFPMARKLDTEQDITDWNSKKIPLAIVHPASVGHGLNLQFGGHIVVWYSLTYDAELYAQTNKRLDRRGQTEIVSIIHLITRNTIDEKVLKVIREKENQTKDFQN
jgi:SNF2 family DNA or RNA helicase